MTNDLSTVLGRAVDELSPTGAPDDLVLARILRGTRRRRVQRHTVESVVGVAAAGVVGTAAWAGLRFTAPPPAVTPTQSATPSPTASASASPSASPSVSPSGQPTTPPPVPASFGQPSSVPVTPAILAGAKAGWMLAMYAPMYDSSAVSDVVASGQTVLYLVSPVGDFYRLFDVPEGDQGSYWLIHWTAGQDRALVAMPDTTYRWLDLRTGGLSPVDNVPAGHQFVGVDARGRTIWQAYDAAGTVRATAPDGTFTDLVTGLAPLSGPLSPGRDMVSSGSGIVDLGTDGARYFSTTNGSCEPVGWLSESEIVIACTHPSTGRQLFSTTFTTAINWDAPVVPPVPLQFDGIAGDSVTAVSPLDDGRLVVSGADAATGDVGVWMVDGSTVSEVWRGSPLQSIDTQVVGTTLFVRTSADDTPLEVIAYDLTTGSPTVMVPAPTESGVEYGLSVWWWQGVTSTVVATDD